MGLVRMGIAFCGGCNPSFDRVGFVEELASRLRGRFLFLGHNEKDLAGLIAVNGCLRACATKDLEPRPLPCYSIAEAGDLEGLLAWLGAFRRDVPESRFRERR